MNTSSNNPLGHVTYRFAYVLSAARRESGSSSPVCVLACRVAACTVLVAISLCGTFATGRSYAATWPLPTSELSASVVFHETYSAGDKSYVHSGIDIPASAGMQISSPQAGTVRYTGAVPSGDSRIGGTSAQKTMNAVSIELQDGRVVTLMPFARVDVSPGDWVDEGACLGTLASEGDISSAQTHLHMGLKMGRSYYDPMSLFGSTAGTACGDEVPVQEAIPAIDYAGTNMDMQAGVLSAEARAQELIGETEAGEVSEPEVLPQESFGTIESDAASWKAPMQNTPAVVSVIGVYLEPLLRACYSQFVGLMSALEGFSHGLGIPLPTLITVCGVMAVASFVILVLFVLRLVAPYANKMWRKGISSLFKREGGDSMHRLFPASGTAFISRSRMSPREVTK